MDSQWYLSFQARGRTVQFTWGRWRSCHIDTIFLLDAKVASHWLTIYNAQRKAPASVDAEVCSSIPALPNSAVLLTSSTPVRVGDGRRCSALALVTCLALTSVSRWLPKSNPKHIKSTFDSSFYVVGVAGTEHVLVCCTLNPGCGMCEVVLLAPGLHDA